MGRRRDADPARDGLTPLILDTAPLVALERPSGRVRAFLREIEDNDVVVIVPAGALAQAWRNGATQARLAHLLGRPGTSVEPLDAPAARATGRLLARTGTRDVVDAHVALIAHVHRGLLVTDDSDDMRLLAPEVRIKRL